MKNIDIIPPSLFLLFSIILLAGQLHIPPLSFAIFLALLVATGGVASMILYRGKSVDEGSGDQPD
jgi:hypothetical protein